MTLDLRAVRERDAALQTDGEAWKCLNCDWCPSCRRLDPCETHDDDTDVLLLMAEIGLLRNELNRCADCGKPFGDEPTLTNHVDRLERHVSCAMGYEIEGR